LLTGGRSRSVSRDFLRRATDNQPEWTLTTVVKQRREQHTHDGASGGDAEDAVSRLRKRGERGVEVASRKASNKKSEGS
jgi:hypothetical protein